MNRTHSHGMVRALAILLLVLTLIVPTACARAEFTVDPSRNHGGV
ncbi:hypothetical protein ACFLW8_02800 [Chloroflexota bacterium]